MKRFNVTGLCIPEKHYMCDVTAKFERCKSLVEDGFYYSINFPRQFGKTTMKSLLRREFEKREDYLVISTSFEGLGDVAFETEGRMAPTVVQSFAKAFRLSNPTLVGFLKDAANKIHSFQDLTEFISNWIGSLDKKVVLIIDEVDKASNNQVFISFLAMLRDKYLAAREEEDLTFHSVVLLGVHDVKTLKLKLRPNEQTQLNSPWNISKNLNISFEFSTPEIAKMLVDYSTENDVEFDVDSLAQWLHYYTSGSPFLVSLLCEMIDEQLLEGGKRAWTVDDVKDAYKAATNLGYTNTNFDDLYKNLENNEDLRHLIKRIAIDGENIQFDLGNSIISLGKTYGILSQNDLGKCDISNKIYEFRITNYLISRGNVNKSVSDLYFDSKFTRDGELNVTLILEKFQLFMKEHYSSKDNAFLEKNGRLLLMSFLRPIVNGKGYLFKENVTAEDRKMDLVITYNDKRYVIELKIWYGEKYLSDGIEQLCDYLDHYQLETGHLLIYNFNKNKEYTTESFTHAGKSITAVFV